MSQWNEKPFIDYLNAVDGLIEASTGKLTQQRDIDQVACAQEAGDTPEGCARMLERRIKIRAFNDALRSRVQMPSSGSIRDMIFLSRRLSTRPTTGQQIFRERPKWPTKPAKPGLPAKSARISF